MAVKGGRIDFMFLAPSPLTRPLDPLLWYHSSYLLTTCNMHEHYEPDQTGSNTIHFITKLKAEADPGFLVGP